MERRDFIKNSRCLGCAGLFASGCDNILLNNKYVDDYKLREKMNAFLIKSKDDLPKKIRLEACSLCQLNCPACGSRQIEKIAPKGWSGYLKFDDFRKFIDDNNFEEVHLSKSGEIFLNPELDEIIEYSYQKGIKLEASANLNTISDKTIENLVKYKFHYMRVALDGATPETYKIYRAGGDFNQVIDNIKKINYFKKKYNSEFPKLSYQFILFGHNEHEIELAKKKAKELDMEIDFKRNYAPRYSPVKNVKLVEKQTGIKIVEENNEYIKVANNTKKSPICNMLFKSPQIDYNGIFLGCCRTSLTNFKVNVFKEGLLNALNDPCVLYAKLMLSDTSTPAKKGVPCSNCDENRLIL